MTEYELTPSPNGCDCIGNGSNPDVECQCDECPHFQECFPYTNVPLHEIILAKRIYKYNKICYDRSICMDTNNHQEMNDTKVDLKKAEEITCDNCCESVLFHLRDQEHEFTMGLSTVLECLMFAIRQGDLPKLPLSWLGDADDVCGTSFSEETQYTYWDEQSDQTKNGRE